jgi:creatinine amidohydrolase
MEKIRYEEMLPHEILARRKRFPAAFIGLGGLEWHGEHLAAGNDALKAQRLCELAAERSGGFAFPTLWYGEPRVGALMEADHDPDGRIRSRMKFKKRKMLPAQFGQTKDQQIESYQCLIRHVLVQMNSLEMKAVCLLCGHYPLYHYAAPVVEQFNREFRDTRAFAGRELDYPARSARVGGDHAAKWETSYLMYLRPDCVDMSVYLGRGREPLVGVMGEDPRRSASAEAGRIACELIVQAMVRKARELLRWQARSPRRLA